MFLPDYVKKVLDVLENNSFEGYLVGGCVRDYLLGKDINDYDIAVSSTPEETKKCFEKWHTIDTGIKHGTVTIVSDSHNLELTTFRVDGEYKDSRHPQNVEFTRSIENDLSRRDFTVNALAFNPNTGIVDLFDGRSDIKNKIIRCVDNADTRFNEDALRIMRCLRFSSVLSFSIEKETSKSVIKNKELLKNISAERIFAEIKKLLNGNNADKILFEYREVFETVIPEIKILSDEKYKKNTDAVKKCPDETTAFAAFASGLGEENINNICNRLKTDKKFRTQVYISEKYSDFVFENEQEVKLFIQDNGIQMCEMLISINKALGKDTDVLFSTLNKVKNGDIYTISQLDISGSDLVKLGFSGKEIGTILDSLLKKVMSGETKNKKEDLIKSIKN